MVFLWIKEKVKCLIMSRHVFKAKTYWSKKEGESTANSSRFSRNHTVSIDGKSTDLNVSAAKVFKGDDALHNPEDLLLSALSSCHMMSFFYLCSLNNIEVITYQDNATGILEVSGDGKGQFASVQLNPMVTVKSIEMIDVAKKLHTEAHRLCFIANSCNFPISHKAEVIVSSPK